MKKGSFLSRLADRLVGSSKFSGAYEKAWSTHAKAFSPIMEPAFTGNSAARIKLVAALNQLSRREITPALKGISDLRRSCETDADYAAIAYFTGLAHELGGNADEARSHYLAAAEYGHHFYLPYVKLAREAHSAAVFDVAEENYLKALGCIDAASIEADQNLRLVAATARSNLASCFTMMHRYSEAKEQLAESIRLLPDQPERSATAAVLYAATSERENVQEQLTLLEKGAPRLLEHTRALTSQILAGKHAQFSALPPKKSLIAPFWQWFEQNEADLIAKLRAQDHESLLNAISERLKPIFPFMQRDLEFGIMIGKDFEHFDMDMADFYSIALQHGYEALLAACPESLKARWTFKIVH